MTVDDIIKEHGSKLYNLAYRLCGDPQWAEDLMQESYLEIHHSLPTFQGHSSTYTWAYKITLHTCLRHTKKIDIKQQAIQSLEETGPAENMGDKEELQPENQIIEAALLAEIKEKCHYFTTFILTQDQRVTLLLKNMFDFKYKEISYLLDISEDQVRSRLSRARNRLNNHLKNRCSWIDADNPCKCEYKTAYVIKKYPQLLEKLKYLCDSEEYRQEIQQKMATPKLDIEKMCSDFPLINHKVNFLLKK